MRNTLSGACCCAILSTAAVPGPANAQDSSVTVFGALDVNVRSVHNGNSRVRFMSTDGLGPTRLGFRGVEDLGGGLRAGFWLESGFSADNGAQLSPGKFWNRRSTVGLSSTRYGELRLGRDLVPVWVTHVFHDVFNGLGLGGSVNLLAPSFAFNYLRSGTLAGQRSDNAVAYFLPPELGGVYGQLMAAPGEGVTGAKFHGGRLGYRSGAIDGSLAYTRTSTLPDALEVLNAGVTYNAGFARLLGLMSAMRAGERKQSNVVVGAAVPVGAAEFKASFGVANASGGGTDANDARQLALGYVYNLSKRTTLYTTYARISNRGSANYIVSPLPSDPLPPPAAGLPANAGKPSRGIDLGIRHAF